MAEVTHARFGAILSLEQATGSMNFRSDELVVIDGHSDVLGHSQEHSLAVFDAVAVATPKNRVSKWHRRLVDSSAFRITIIVLIILNTVLLALEHHDMRGTSPMPTSPPPVVSHPTGVVLPAVCRLDGQHIGCVQHCPHGSLRVGDGAEACWLRRAGLLV